MPVDTKHPDYEDRALEWEQMRDCVRGEVAVKARTQHLWQQPYAVAEVRDIPNADPYDTEPGAGQQAVVVVGAPQRLSLVSEYLPMPDGFRLQKDGGRYMYRNYLTRAQFPEILTPTINGMVGLILRKEAKIELPESMSSLYESATPDGLSIESFHKRVVTELLTMGRYSILPDLPTEANGNPYLAGYSAEALINWDEDRAMFVLDECGLERDPGDEFSWREVKRYRVLRLTGSSYTQQLYTDDQPGAVLTPTKRGGGALGFVPLVTMSAGDLVVCPDNPPLIGVARSSLAMFRLDADYRHQLYMSGQETLVVSGAEGSPDAIGAGVVLNLPLNAKAEYVGPSCLGIDAHRQAIMDEREAAANSGAKMLDSGNKAGVEAAEALRIRFASQGATLVSVAMTAAQGIERALKNAALMVGADPNKVVVTPNLEFVDTLLDPKAAMELVKAWQADAISFDTLHENLQRGGISSVERTVDQERALIANQAPPPPSERRQIPTQTTKTLAPLQ